MSSMLKSRREPVTQEDGDGIKVTSPGLWLSGRETRSNQDGPRRSGGNKPPNNGLWSNNTTNLGAYSYNAEETPDKAQLWVNKGEATSNHEADTPIVSTADVDEGSNNAKATETAKPSPSNWNDESNDQANASSESSTAVEGTQDSTCIPQASKSTSSVNKCKKRIDAWMAEADRILMPPPSKSASQIRADHPPRPARHSRPAFYISTPPAPDPRPYPRPDIRVVSCAVDPSDFIDLVKETKKADEIKRKHRHTQPIKTYHNHMSALAAEAAAARYANKTMNREAEYQRRAALPEHPPVEGDAVKKGIAEYVQKLWPVKDAKITPRGNSTSAARSEMARSRGRREYVQARQAELLGESTHPELNNVAYALGIERTVLEEMLSVQLRLEKEQAQKCAEKAKKDEKEAKRAEMEATEMRARGLAGKTVEMMRVWKTLVTQNGAESGSEMWMMIAGDNLPALLCGRV